MSFAGSDSEDKLRATTSISKRPRLPTKFFDDYNTVDHASVPRKLRSATKKRNHKSISPPLSDKKKRNHVINGVELLRKGARKKCKQLNQQRDSDRSLSHSIEGPITKDEEEVVETLSALAAMFRFPVTERNDFDCKLVNAKSSPMPDEDSRRPAFEAPEKEEDLNSHCPSTNAEAANPSLLEGLANPSLEAVQVKCSTEYHREMDNTISQRSLEPMFLLRKSEHNDGKPFCSSIGCKVQSDLNLGIGSKHPKHEEATICARNPAAAISRKQELQFYLEERKDSGSASWPGLFAAESNVSVTQEPFVQSLTAKPPGCLDMDSSLARPGSLDDGVLTDKDSIAPVSRKKTWKSCSAHIHICNLIKHLEIAERKDESLFQPTQLTVNERSKEGGVLSEANNLDRVQSGLNGIVSSHTVTAEKNPNEIRNATLLHKRLLQDQHQVPTQKQCFDFLSLSARSGGVEASTSTNKVENVLEPLTQFHNPYLHSPVQNQTILPFSMPQIRFCSTPFPDNPSPASAKQVQIPPPPHVGTPILGPPNLVFSASPKQEQQQWIWTTQYRPTGVAATHFPNWHNGRYDPYGIHYAQFILPPSHSSLEVLGPKYSPVSQQQLLCNKHL